MRRHQIGGHRVPADEALGALREICGWMGWNADELRAQVDAQAQAAGIDRAEALNRYFTRELRQRLNAAKWEFVRQHPGDPAAVEIVELARSWQARLDRRDPDDNRPLELPSDEEAYGEPERHPEGSG